jgi:hypothetical protein
VRSTVSRDECDLSARGKGRDGDGRRGLSPGLLCQLSRWFDMSIWLTVSISRVLLGYQLALASIEDWKDSHKGQVVKMVKTTSSNTSDKDCDQLGRYRPKN